MDLITQPDNYTTISNYMRKRNIRAQTTILSDISEFIRAHPTIQYRYLVQASKDPLPAYELLNFNPYNAKTGIDLGIADAKRTVEMGPGESFKKFIHENNEVEKKMLQESNLLLIQ